MQAHTRLLTLVATATLALSGCGGGESDFAANPQTPGGGENAAPTGTLSFREDVILPHVDTLGIVAHCCGKLAANICNSGFVLSENKKQPDIWLGSYRLDEIGLAKLACPPATTRTHGASARGASLA